MLSKSSKDLSGSIQEVFQTQMPPRERLEGRERVYPMDPEKFAKIPLNTPPQSINKRS